MERVADLCVPLAVDVMIGCRWGESRLGGAHRRGPQAPTSCPRHLPKRRAVQDSLREGDLTGNTASDPWGRLPRLVMLYTVPSNSIRTA